MLLWGFIFLAIVAVGISIAGYYLLRFPERGLPGRLSDHLGDDKELEQEQQAISTPMPGMAYAAKPLQGLSPSTTGGQIESLIASAGLSEEEEEAVAGALIEMTKQLLSIIEIQHKMRKEG